MGDEMLNVFYSSEFLHPHRLEKSVLSTGLKSHRLSGEPQFKLFRDYFGLINLVQNTRLMEKENIESLHEFPFQKRERVGSVDSDRSFSSDSSSATTDDLNFESYGRKTPSPSLAPGTPVKVIRRGDLTESSRNRKNKSEGRRNRNVNVCVFCRNNGESKKVYSSHVLKDSDGNTTCPILRAYTCPLCKCSGDQSHTIKYCPQNKNLKQEK